MITGKGNVLATPGGFALYVYKPDTAAMGGTAAKSTCTGGCLVAWPLFYAGATVTVPAGLNASDFGAFTRSDDNMMQSTYQGWPLYTYVNDKKPDEATGDGAPNGPWFAVRIPFTAP